ncbi:hypothetical protein DRO51_04385 [Candidatus Bathyarchaeota archaeon]|nr:MAG: hypothetical protein DRO51_04385 [Candidatus Bathyarchaeota archaeon]
MTRVINFLQKVFYKTKTEKAGSSDYCILYQPDKDGEFYCWLYPQKRECPTKGKLKNNMCKQYNIQKQDLYTEYLKNRGRTD